MSTSAVLEKISELKLHIDKLEASLESERDYLNAIILEEDADPVDINDTEEVIRKLDTELNKLYAELDLLEYELDE